ncbi:hypothetical protein SEPCBS57363_006469 [Sporothrix epigloea]|uniref:Cupin 2 conserved barrel domain-containing protein n=1 Tax=Sporothrix epigloea TaxID=1892477 RepID=A0ABP0E371_9PEZI
MAALLPILQEILPMLMPGPVHVTRAEELLGTPYNAAAYNDHDSVGVASGGEAASDGGDEDDGENEPWAEAEAGRAGTDRHEDGEEDWAENDMNLTRKMDGDDTTRAPSLRPGPERRKPKLPERPKRAGRYLHNGVSLRDAIVHKSGSLCASVLTVKPQCSTVVFHNGEQEAIVYAVSGTATFATLPEDFDEYGDDSEQEQEQEQENETTNGASTASHHRRGPEPAKTVIHAGDFVFIPPWTEHQVRNEGALADMDGTGKPADDVVWVVVRNAGEPTVVPLQGWGGEQAG